MEASATTTQYAHWDAIPPVPRDIERPLWSVMIPTHNCAEYLAETLASVLVQDPGSERLQIEVVDDASSDDPKAVVDDVGRDRVSFYRQPRNVGHVSNFTTCLRRSRGHLVHLLHGDDCVLSGFYEAMSRPFLEHPEVGAAFCRHIYMDDDGHWTAIGRLLETASGPLARPAERILSLLGVQTPAMVVRREVYEHLGGFDRRAGFAEDTAMWVRIAGHYPVWYEQEPLALYRARPGSNVATSMHSGRNVRDARRAIDLVRGHLPADGERQAVKAARARAARWAVKNSEILLGEGDVRGAAAQIREGLVANPSVTAARSLAVVAERLLSDRAAEKVVRVTRHARPAPEPGVERPPAIAPVPPGEARPLWSVMIPTYNSARHLHETLASVLAQDPGPDRMQIEVVDDASEDDPHDLVEEVGGGRVAFHRQASNVGHTKNFNTCLQRSRGQLIHLLHGDDSVREGFYATMGRKLEEEREAAAAFCRYIAMDEDGRWQTIAPLVQRSPGIISNWLGRIAVGQCLQTHCMVVRREVYERLGGFRDGLHAEDWEMWVRIAAHYPVAYAPEPLALYRIHPVSRTRELLRSGENVRDLRRVMAINRRHLGNEADEITRRALRETAKASVRRARRLLGVGDIEAMWAQLREAVRSDASPRVLAGAAAVIAGRIAVGLGLVGGKAPEA